MIEKQQINSIRDSLMTRIRRVVEKENGCIGTYYKNRGQRYTEQDAYDGNEYDSSLIVGIHDTLSSSPSDYEAMILMEIFIDPEEDILCCAFKPDGGTQFDHKIEVVITDSLPRIIDWLVEHGFDTDTEEEVLYCSECGHKDVQIMAWVLPNEGMMYCNDVSTIDDDDNNFCDNCFTHPVLLTHEEMLEQVNAWWDDSDTETWEKITGISIDRFDGGEMPAYESACQAYWDGLTDEEKIAAWQKWKE